MWFKLLVPILLFSAFSAWAKVVDLSSPALYDPRGNTELYGQVIATIRPGDIVKFENGASFTIHKKLGEGKASAIYSIRERPHQILRLALDYFRLIGIEATLEGYEELKDSNIRLVKIDPSSNNRYILAERISSDYITLAEMFLGFDPERVAEQARSGSQNNYLPRRLNPKIKDEMLEAFWEFVKSVAPFQSIADLHERNVVYDRNKKAWVLIDWANWNYRITDRSHAYLVDATVNQLFDFLEQKDLKIFVSTELQDELEKIKAKMRDLLRQEKLNYLEQQAEHKAEVTCKQLLNSIIHMHF